jgi:hypothetical protein
MRAERTSENSENPVTETLPSAPTRATPAAAAATPAAASTPVAGYRFWAGVALVAGGVAVFLGSRLSAWPPHEDETLALFVGRDSLGGVVEHVTQERGGAPLHFLVAWAVAHAGIGLEGLRAASAVFAVASLPLVALLGLRLADRRTALLATALAAGSWMLLFHGVYGRMYSLFLCTSLLAWLALLRALDRRGAGPWALWALAVLSCLATHPYGALVLASQAAFVLLARRGRLRDAAWALAAVLVAGIPFWLADLVLAGRFDVGVGGGGERLGGLEAVVRYLWRTAGDFTAGWWPLTAVAVALGAVGLASVRRETRLLAVACAGVPALAFLLARLGSGTSPESRHLIFALPVAAVLVAAGIVRLTRSAPALGPALAALLVAAQLAWTWERTPGLFTAEPSARVAARAEAGAYLAGVVRSEDVLFAYDPLWLDAWRRDRDFPRDVVPRADAELALRELRSRDHPLGAGVWVLDASKSTNADPALRIAERSPTPAAEFVVRAFGPFLVVRTTQPTETPRRYLALAARVQLLGRSLRLGDADVNLRTVERAEQARRGYASSERSLSTSSR